ncbi:MAG: hypothetical protein AAFP82_16085, partial [Bacteroidota bacterium]
MSKLDICYIVSHGFASRMVLQTNLLGRLVKKGFKVGLITPDQNDENLYEASQEQGFKLISFNLKSDFWNENYYNKRKYLFEDIESNPALWEKHIRATKFNSSKHPWRHIRPYLNFWLYKRIKKIPKLRQKYIQKEQLRLNSKDADSLIKKYAPKILVSTYPVNWKEAVLLHAGNKYPNTKTILHLLSWDNITCKGHFPELADAYITWGKIMSEELKEYYQVDQSVVYECGVPHFDLHIETRKKPNPGEYVKNLGLDSDQPYLFFAMSSPYFAPREIDIVEWLGKEVMEDRFGSEMQLIIRPHPQNVSGNMMDSSWLPRLEKLNALKRVAIDYPKINSESGLKWSMQKEDMRRLSNLIVGSSLVFNSGSTVSIDALLLNVPVILTSFDGLDDVPYWKSAKRLIQFPHL